MFNLTKKEVAKATQQFISSFTPTVTVKMIHDEFDSAVDGLINKAINLKPDDKEKHDKLKSLGFGKSKHVIQTEALVYEANEQKKISDFVNYYRQNYPFNKFITHPLAENICKKYGLVLGDAADYIGEIPEKNINEIASFALRDEDKIKNVNGWYKINYRDGNHIPSILSAKKDDEGAFHVKIQI